MRAREDDFHGLGILLGYGAFQQDRVRWRVQFLILAKRGESYCY